MNGSRSGVPSRLSLQARYTSSNQLSAATGTMTLKAR